MRNCSAMKLQFSNRVGAHNIGADKKRFGGKRGVRSVENGSVENAECGKCGVWKMRSGKCWV